MTKRSPFRYFKTSTEIIRLAVTLCIRFPLSLRNVEDLLHERGPEIGYDTIQYWWDWFGVMFAAKIWKHRVLGMRPSQWQSHFVGVFVEMYGGRHHDQRTVVHEGEVG